MQIGLSLGFGWRYDLGVTITHGPTVQIAGTTSPLSLVHGTSGTFPGTAKDINDVATGTQTYVHSSDESIIRIDDAAARTYTVLGTATQTVTITENLIAPVTSTEPFYTGAVGQTLMLQDNMDAHVSATAMSADTGDYTTMRFVAGSSPLIDSGTVDTSRHSVITPGRSGSGNAIRLSYPDQSDGVQRSAAWYSYPLADTIDPGALKIHNIQWWSRINFPLMTDGAPPNQLNIKWLELVHHQGDGGRTEWHTHDSSPWNASTPGVGTQAGAPAHAVYWQMQDNATYPLGIGNQACGPYLSDLNDNAWRRYTHQYRPHTASSATISIDHTTLIATFSTSQLGLIANGSYLAIQALRSPYTVSGLAGDGLTCTLTKVIADGDAAPLSADVVTRAFSSVLDGYARMWIDGVKVIDVSLAGVSVLPTGGEKYYATLGEVSALGVAIGSSSIRLGSTRTLVGGPFTVDYDDFTWWVE